MIILEKLDVDDKIGYETINIEILNFDTFLNINTRRLCYSKTI